MAELRAPPTRQKPGGRGGIGKRGRRPGAKGAAAAAAAAAAAVASSASAKGSVAANEDNDVDSDGDVAGNGSASNDYMNELEEHINDLGDSWETESLFEDVLEDLTEENQFSVSDPEACTPEESARFRQELRAVGPEEFCRRTVDAGVITAKRLLTAFGVRPPNFLEGEPDESYFGLLSLALSRELLKRAKLPHFNSVEDAVHLLQTCNNIIVLTGAGISTSLGIPDFRSKDIGLYSRLEHLGLSDPQEVFDINLFRQDPTIFYSVARDILPSTDKFTPTHAFIALLQQKGKLLTNYSQNIDNLEAKAGIKPNKLVQCHGSFATASCIVCGYHVDGESIFPTIKAGRIPHCPRCASLRGKKRKGMSRDDDASPALSRSNSIDSNTVGTGSGASTSASTGAPAAARRGRPRGRPARVGRPPGRPRLARRKNNGSSSGSDNEDGFSVPSHGGVMKPDITFFGEPLPDEFSRRLTEIDRYQADLVVVIGTSLKVAPVSEVVPFMPANVPQIYISRTPVNHINFDIDLLGDCDVVVAELCRRAGWDLNHEMVPPKQQVYIETPPGAYSSRHVFTDVTPGLSKAGPAEPVAVKEEKDDKAQTEGDDASYRDEKKPDIAGGDTDNAHNGHDQREDKAAQEETATVMGLKE